VGRPAGYQWQPLGCDTDPVPGDPQALGDQVQQLNAMAETLQDQIAALNKIASDNTEIGQHADKIRSSAVSLVGSLGTLLTRYRNVSSALSGWILELGQAQSMSLRALNDAEAPYAKLNNSVPPSGKGFTVSSSGTVTTSAGTTLTAAQEQEVSSYQNSMRQAQAEIAGAQALLNQATNLRDTQASHYASKINNECNDDLRDHWSFSGFIHEIAGALKLICTILETIAAVLAIIALFATGVGWLLLAAFILTAVALALRVVLAATGNGSWLDVAIDAFALLTLGVSGGLSGTGGLIGRAGQTVDSAVEVGDDITTSARAASSYAKAANVLDKWSDAISDAKFVPNVVKNFLSAGFDFGSDALTAANEEAFPMATTMVKDLEETSAWSRIFNGGEEPANLAVKMAKLAEKFPDSQEILDFSAKFSSQLTKIRLIIGSGIVVSGSGVGLAIADPKWWDNWEHATGEPADS
jgi:uncharacterized protein YlxW (UPF0749 family)